MAPKKSRSKKTMAQDRRPQEPFLPFSNVDTEWRFEGLAGYIADESNENGRTAIAHAIEITGYGAAPPLPTLMSLFLHVVLTTYGVVLAHLHPKSLLALVIFQHLYEAFIGMYPSVALFRYFYSLNLDTGGTISGSLVFRLHPQMVTCYIPVS
jgi:hypothetical protein